MRKVIALFGMGLVLIVWAATANAQDKTRRALAEELLDVTKMKENIENSFSMISGQMEKVKQSAEINVSSETEKMMDNIKELLSWDKMKEDYINLYAETFTEKELKGIIDFYKSTAGKAFINKQPEVMKRSMELSSKIMAQIMPKIKESMKTPSSQEKDK